MAEHAARGVALSPETAGTPVSLMICVEDVDDTSAEERLNGTDPSLGSG